MSGQRHPTPAERLLALLADERALETLPSDEVRADLAAIGIDPGRCVAFARALAGGTDSPGGRLLGAIDLAEDQEDEIARIESADIEEVRAQIPEGTAAAIAAAARRQAGADSNVVAMKPRRSRILRWGGPLAGIAASVLVIAVMGIQFMQTERQLVSSDAPSPMMAPQARAPAEQASRGDEARESFALETPADRKKLERGPGVESGEFTDRLASQASPEAEMPAAAAPSTGILGNVNEEPASDIRESADRLRAEGAGAAPAAAGAETERLLAKPDPDRALAGAPAAVAAMVIVDPSQVPLAVQSQALPQPDLAARVDEARRLAGDRPVIALYRVTGPSGRQDFAQVPLEVAMSQQMPAPTPLTRLLGPEAMRYDFLVLPPE